MNILWFTFAMAFVLAFGARFFASSMVLENHTILEGRRLPNKVLTASVAILLLVISGLRRNIGDTYFYMFAYETQTYTLDNLEFKGDYGFTILQALLQKVSPDPQILVFFCALVTNILIIAMFRKYSSLFEVAVYVYIASGYYLVTMNGMRQSLVASIIFAATPFLLKRDWKKYFLIVLLASTIHESALIMLVAYFFVNGKAWKAKTLMILGVGLLVMAGYQQFSAIIFSALQNTQYGHYQDFQEGGANIVRVMVSAAPLLVAFLGRKKLEKLTPHSDLLVNMSILGLFFMILSSQNWIFARMALYFNLYQIILISWLVQLFVKREQKLVYIAMLFLYLAFYIYEQVITLRIVYNSNYF